MRDTIVTLKSGEVVEGPLWEFRPEEGYFTIPSAYEGPIHFRDCESVITKNERIRVDLIADRDELERARRMGWNGE